MVKKERGEVWNRTKPHNRIVSGLMRILDVSEGELRIPVQFPKQYGEEIKHLPVDALPQDIYGKLRTGAEFRVSGTLKTHYLVDLRFSSITYVEG